MEASNILEVFIAEVPDSIAAIVTRLQAAGNLPYTWL